MRAATSYKRQTLALFFIVSLVPALVVAAIWYLNAQINGTQAITVNFNSFVLPVMLLGVVPALVLSLLFAELLTRPIRQLYGALIKLSSGRFLNEGETDLHGEFGELGAALQQLSTILDRTRSETRSQGDLVAAERNKLSGVLNSMTDGVFALDSAGRIILFNHAAASLTGHTIGEAAGQLADKIIPLRENGELVMARWLATQKGTEHKVGQWTGLELYRADGTSLFVDVQAVVLPNDPNGISALITFHDVTASHELEQMKIDFVALAAHELRTPLTEVRGYLDVLRHDLKRPTKDQSELIERALTGAGRLTDLVNNLLSVARIEHGDINYRPEKLDYANLIEELRPGIESRAKLAGRKLRIHVASRLPRLVADPSGLRQVITNLTDNAFVHTTAGTGSVTLDVRATPDGIETTVADNGEGIPLAAQSHLFTKFYRVNELTAQTSGTGLGLYICREIVEAHGGAIDVISAPGEGSTFRFTLPKHTVARAGGVADNTITTRGAHGWIKDHSVR